MTLELSHKDPRIAHFFRSYKGRKAVRVSASTSHSISSYWDGGSRDYNYFYDLNTGEQLTLEQMGYQQQTQNNPFNQQMGEVQIKPGQVVAVQSVFCGKPGTPRLYVNPEDLPKFQ